ncbi:NUDIX domain-containing protein [Nocardioides sp. LHG3406-4]|uniref:NUDIX domain-containing protein n=1 Tax=Nocardioides sp. LHG3406-4 TaxID=2804575 RepID=UPI003CF23976
MQTVVGAAVIRDGCVLAARRTAPPEAAGRWEFPGGKVDPGETPDGALVREVAEELGLAVAVAAWLDQTVRISAEYTLRVAICRPGDGEPVPTEHDQVRWLAPEELGDVDWLEADRPFLDDVRERLLDGEPLDGGNVGQVVRIGSTVRRPTGPWTPAVHALLDHLAQAGLRGVPRVHGIDERGREVLDFMPGEVIDVDSELLSPARLRDLAAWTREFHEAAAGFDHPGPWRMFPVGDTDRIGHNDLAPYNVAFVGDRVGGVFDWDLAGPTTAATELAHQAWNAVPLFRAIPADVAAARLTALAGGYGGLTGREVLDNVDSRVTAAAEGVRAMIESGDPGGAGLAAVGEPGRTLRALAGMRERRPRIEEILAR